MNTRWWSRRMCAHLLLWELQNCNTAEQPSTGECWIPPKKDTTCPRAKKKKKPQQNGRRGETTFGIKCHTHQRCSESSNKTLCTRTLCARSLVGPRDPTETEPDMLLSVWGSPEEALVNSGLTWGQGLWLQQPWPCSVCHKPSWRTLPLAPPKSHQADNPQTTEQLHQRNSHTVKKLLAPT